jgi:hypothetical protein
MPALIIILFVSGSAWVLFALFRRLRQDQVSFGLWMAAGLFCSIGLALGTWCAFYCEYHVGTDYRFGSFPIPVVFLSCGGRPVGGFSRSKGSGLVLRIYQRDYHYRACYRTPMAFPGEQSDAPTPAMMTRLTIESQWRRVGSPHRSTRRP